MQGCLFLRPALPLPDLWCDPEQVYNLGPRLPHAQNRNNDKCDGV